MARKQTRRSVSVKGITHQRIKTHLKGASVAGFIEDLIEEKLGPPTAEDRRKFGEWVDAREKEPKPEKAKETPDVETEIQDPPEPEFTTEPEEAIVAKVVESVKIPDEHFRDAGPTGTGQHPDPEPEPEPKPQKRRLSKGTPLEPKTKEPVEEEPDEFKDYVDPITFF